MYAKSAAAVLALAAALPAFAGEALMTRPIEAGSIATEDLNLVAYYVPAQEDGFVEVTATWAPTDGGAAHRLVMRMADGDAVTFSLPGHMDTSFTFAREEDVVRVSSTPVTPRFKAASL